MQTKLYNDHNTRVVKYKYKNKIINNKKDFNKTTILDKNNY